MFVLMLVLRFVLFVFGTNKVCTAVGTMVRTAVGINVCVAVGNRGLCCCRY